MTYLSDSFRLAKQAEAMGKTEAACLAWKAHGFFATAADFRKIRNQHPVAKSSHGKGVRLLKKAKSLIDC